MTFALTASLAARGVELELEVATGETVAVLGPNGAGKSTLLNLIAGLLRADTGRAELDGATLFAEEPPRTFSPPHLRGVSLLAQEALLFPHLSVLENVAFGPRSSGMRANEARETARRWLAEVDALELAARRPAELSGGQAQRIAVARALASSPRLLLLDEPLAALDVAVAPALRSMLRRVLADRTVLIVTHDVLDAYTLADRVVLLEGGRIVDHGPTRAVLARPRTEFAAGLAGVRLLRGDAAPDGLTLGDGTRLRATTTTAGASGPVVAAVRPSDVSVARVRQDGGAVNQLRDVVTDLEQHGDVVRVRSRSISADVLPAVVADLDLAVGEEAWFAFAPDAAVVYPA